MTSHLRGPAILFAIGIGFANASGVANALPQFPQVRYEVSGPAVAEYISYQGDNGQQRAVNAPLPWSTEFTSFGGQAFVLSAQGAGPITCKILLDGNVVSNATATTGTPARTMCSH
ncbi:MmpS family transport accessory protein [Mycobacterium sp. 852002-51057_SCH5723018]|uniref:MmpS family transport accessory protein n=1 Tax=Mycobacterium sp. 852002-51057_SCH5723018 TaxID=1834094 RepID=UPI000A56D771|nr:MmpS family transport accessory protein [Mycobacterium sp. 852002-51057_SCH5723018]